MLASSISLRVLNLGWNRFVYVCCTTGWPGRMCKVACPQHFVERYLPNLLLLLPSSRLCFFFVFFPRAAAKGVLVPVRVMRHNDAGVRVRIEGGPGLFGFVPSDYVTDDVLPIDPITGQVCQGYFCWRCCCI